MSWLFDLVLELFFTAIQLALCALFAGLFSKRKPAQQLGERQREVSSAPARAVQASKAPPDCPECRAYNPPGSTFCGECGAPLVALEA
jgi:hypothetical protein